MLCWKNQDNGGGDDDDGEEQVEKVNEWEKQVRAMETEFLPVVILVRVPRIFFCLENGSF